MKKIISTLLTACLLFLLVIPAMAISPYDFLLAKGYSKEFLDALSDEMLVKMQSAIGDNDVTNIETETKTFYIDNMDVVRPLGSDISASSLTITLTMSEICAKGSNVISQALVSVDWSWSGTKPMLRKQDALVFNWDETLFTFAANSFYAQDKYRAANSSNEWIIHRELTVPGETAQASLGYLADLYNNPIGTQVGGSCLLVLTVKNRGTMLKGNSSTTSVHLNYYHDSSTWLTSLSLGCEYGSITVSPLNHTNRMSATTQMHYKRR